MTQKRTSHYVLEYIAQGMKPADIARTLKISRQRVTQILKAHGIHYRQRQLKPTRPVYEGIGAPLRITTPEIRAEMKRRFSAGESMTDIAVDFQCSRTWVSQIINGDK